MLSGTINVAGWAVDDTAVSSVHIYTDGVDRGAATLGVPRPDLANEYPNAPPNAGFSYLLNTTLLANGPHTIAARAMDPATHTVTLLKNVTVTVNNGYVPCGTEAIVAGATPVRAQHVTELRACIAAAVPGVTN